VAASDSSSLTGRRVAQDHVYPKISFVLNKASPEGGWLV
jgi:hypothetical protein